MRMNVNKKYLLMRLQWEYHRIVAALGITRLIFCAAILLAVAIHQSFIVPSLVHKKIELARTVSKIAAIRAIEMRLNAPVASLSDQVLAENRDVLELANKMGFSTDDVTYLQIQGSKKNSNKSVGKNTRTTTVIPARTLITLLTSGAYPQFRKMMQGLTTMQGAKVEAFSLTRKAPEETEIAIEMKVSIQTRGAQ